MCIYIYIYILIVHIINSNSNDNTEIMRTDRKRLPFPSANHLTSTVTRCPLWAKRMLSLDSPASKRGQDKRFFFRSAAIYHNYDIIMA